MKAGMAALSRRLAILVCSFATAFAQGTVETPFVGVVHIARTETAPRRANLHILKIDLNAPGLRFKLTAPGGKRETKRQTTLKFLEREKAQIAINVHFFLPFPSRKRDVWLVGLAASEGEVYSAFEAPAQSYAIVANAPGINIDALNRASLVHRDPAFADGMHVLEPVALWNALAGSAQIVTDGVRTIPVYVDERNLAGLLTPGGPRQYSNSKSWYEVATARTAVGLSRDNRTLICLTVDRATVSEIAGLLIGDYGVYNALNLDGGGSTTLVFEDPVARRGRIVNVPSGNPKGRAVGSNLAIFARPLQKLAAGRTFSEDTSNAQTSTRLGNAGRGGASRHRGHL
jgi:hypothetical protein